MSFDPIAVNQLLNGVGAPDKTVSNAVDRLRETLMNMDHHRRSDAHALESMLREVGLSRKVIKLFVLSGATVEVAVSGVYEGLIHCTTYPQDSAIVVRLSQVSGFIETGRFDPLDDEEK